MPKCVRCGKPRGWLYALCDECLSLGEGSPAHRAVITDAAETHGVEAPAATPAIERPAHPIRYATFPRRLNAISADTVVLAVLTAVVFAILPAVDHSPSVRLTVMVCWWATLLFYEPASVAAFGGTPGHRLCNLRVVDDRTGRNVGFGTAVLRFWIKGLLGLFSFFTMNFTRQHRAIHDLATRSTVQIRDPSRARPEHYLLGQAPAP